MPILIYQNSSRRLKSIDAKFALQIDDWDDYSFRTTYHLHYKHGKSSTDVTFIGTVKILKLGQTIKDYSLVTEPFETLEPEYVSVGTSLDYYQRLNQIPENDRVEIMDALQDAVAHPELIDKFRHEPGWTKSVFRDDTEWAKFLDAASVIYDGNFSALPDVAEQFTFYPADSEDEIQFNFSSPRPEFYEGPFRKVGTKRHKTLLPDRIVVLVGRNGSGKSTLLSRLAHVAFASPQARNSEEISRLGKLMPNSIGFMRVITISYSAFDSFIVPGIDSRNISQTTDDIESGRGRFVFCGLRDIVAEVKADLKLSEKSKAKKLTSERRSSTRLKSLDTLAAEFGRLIEDIRSADLMDLFEAALEPLLNEPSFSNLNNQLETLLKADSKDAAFVFLEWSTGHKIALHVIASLVRNTKSQSLVLFDEPETHLHPPLMAALMQSVRIVLTDLNAFCVIATHSPVLLQETLAEHVRYVRRIGDTLHIENPKLETFGENVGVLTYSSFGLTASSTDYHEALDLLIKGCDSMDKVNEFFPLGLSGQATAYVLAKLYEKSKAK